ncbi:MAG: hypothetical protein R2880_15205 [Deinococcales bacterium]
MKKIFQLSYVNLSVNLSRFFSTFLLLGLALSGYAQMSSPFPRLNGVVATDGSRLDAAAINRSAEALTEQGIKTLVLFMDGPIGESLDESEVYFQKALQNYGLASSGGINDDVLGILVGTRQLSQSENTRPIFIYYGTKLDELMEKRLGSVNFADSLRNNMVNDLQEGNFTKAITNALDSTNRGLKGGATSLPWTWWLLGGTGVVGGAYALSRRKKSSEVAPKGRALGPNTGANAASASEGLAADINQIKMELSNLLIDLESQGEQAMGQDHYLPSDYRQHKDLVLMEKLTAQDRPEFWQRLRADYDEERLRLEHSGQIFIRLADKDPLSESEVAELKRALDQAQSARDFSAGLEQKVSELQREITNFSSGLKEVEQNLRNLEVDYERLEGIAHKEDIFRPLNQQLDYVATAVKEDKPMKAIDLLYKTREDINGLRQKLEQRAELRRTGPTRLEALEQAGEKAKALITRGVAAFDKVDDYAPSNWADIRGNGSEAQHAAERAFELWQEAEAFQRQDEVILAASYMDEAFAELKRVDDLIAAIETRLENLDRAKHSAQSQLAQLRAEIGEQERFSQAVDDEENRIAFAKARELLISADRLMAEEAKDWLSIMRLIQEADELGDKAYAKSKELAERLSQQQRRTDSEKQETLAEFDKLRRYLQVHPELQQLSEANLRPFERILAELESLERRPNQGETLVNQLGDAAKGYDDLEKQLENLFSQLEGRFKAIESLRKQIWEDLKQTEKRLDELLRTAQRSVNREISQAADDMRRDFPRTNRVNEMSEEELRRYDGDLKDYNDRLERLLRQARQIPNSGYGGGGFGLPSMPPMMPNYPRYPGHSRIPPIVIVPPNRSGGGFSGGFGGGLGEGSSPSNRSPMMPSPRSLFDNAGGGFKTGKSGGGWGSGPLPKSKSGGGW